jgi:hypothetical protein
VQFGELRGRSGSKINGGSLLIDLDPQSLKCPEKITGIFGNERALNGNRLSTEQGKLKVPLAKALR